MFEATIEVYTKYPEAVYRAILPETKDVRRFKVSLSLEEDRLFIKISSPDPTGLRAGLNSYLRILMLLDSVEEKL